MTFLRKLVKTFGFVIALKIYKNVNGATRNILEILKVENEV